ncbi:hypothetical protein BDN71DRAFT_1453242 [Pleurotus eryngii]|uniref:Uncharacterized protein n=1 Tax=Pleurotus eryngii TaxID=5323 RepID=A0A9P5ZNX9_PLEER|nr:hypothetical protein BDN71DRAFT_1453242 [Pleurotus eryngii]
MNPEQNNLDVPSYHPAKITIPPQPTPASRLSKLCIHSPFLCAATAASRLAASANLCPAIQSRGMLCQNLRTRPTCCRCRRIADDTVDAHTGTSYGSTQFSNTTLSTSPQGLQVAQRDLA